MSSSPPVPRTILGLPARLLPFFGWLLAFYLFWSSAVTLGERWGAVLAHWPIALAMTFGSYVAGSTPMGGGTVGFPVLVLLFDLPGSFGRNFALAIQSVGMVSASFFILANRQPLAWGLLRPALLGSLVGTPLGAACLARYVPDLGVKLVFATVWASFGLLHLVKMKELVRAEGMVDRSARQEMWAGLVIGVSGGLVASVTGVGTDMILYATMVLLYRADAKISIPSSVVLMAFTSVVGISANLLLARLAPEHYGIDPDLLPSWLAAAPIVAVGAPFGALVVHRVGRTPTLVFVSILCLLQFFWTLAHDRVTGWPLAGAILGVLAMNGLFHLLYRWGRAPALTAGGVPAAER